MNKQTKVPLCSAGLCPLWGRCPASPLNNWTIKGPFELNGALATALSSIADGYPTQKNHNGQLLSDPIFLGQNIVLSIKVLALKL